MICWNTTYIRSFPLTTMLSKPDFGVANQFYQLGEGTGDVFRQMWQANCSFLWRFMQGNISNENIYIQGCLRQWELFVVFIPHKWIVLYAHSDWLLYSSSGWYMLFTLMASRFASCEVTPGGRLFTCVVYTKAIIHPQGWWKVVDTIVMIINNT